MIHKTHLKIRYYNIYTESQNTFKFYYLVLRTRNCINLFNINTQQEIKKTIIKIQKQQTLSDRNVILF